MRKLFFENDYWKIVILADKTFRQVGKTCLCLRSITILTSRIFPLRFVSAVTLFFCELGFYARACIFFNLPREVEKIKICRAIASFYMFFRCSEKLAVLENLFASVVDLWRCWFFNSPFVWVLWLLCWRSICIVDRFSPPSHHPFHRKKIRI